MRGDDAEFLNIGMNFAKAPSFGFRRGLPIFGLLLPFGFFNRVYSESTYFITALLRLVVLFVLSAACCLVLE